MVKRGPWSTETRLPASPCENCGRELDAATGDGQPSPGDISICIGCGTVRQFDAEMRLEPVDGESLPVETRAEINCAARAIRRIHARRPS